MVGSKCRKNKVFSSGWPVFRSEDSVHLADHGWGVGWGQLPLNNIRRNNINMYTVMVLLQPSKWILFRSSQLWHSNWDLWHERNIPRFDSMSICYVSPVRSTWGATLGSCWKQLQEVWSSAARGCTLTIQSSKASKAEPPPDTHV